MDTESLKKSLLSKFQDVETLTPAIVTTSQMLTTGVDAPSDVLIELDGLPASAATDITKDVDRSCHRCSPRSRSRPCAQRRCSAPAGRGRESTIPRCFALDH